MTFYFDTNIGVALPQALALLKLPVGITWHNQHFRPSEQDDVWLRQVGAWGWFVVGHDRRFHARPNELAALWQANVGCFYMAGAQLPRWEKMRIFARAYDRIIDAATNTPRPFAYSVWQNGALKQIRLPMVPT